MYQPARLTDDIIKRLQPPPRGNKLKRDTEAKGLAIRVTAAGNKTFVFNYRRRADGVERRQRIGQFGDWSVSAARVKARELRSQVDNGGDPLGDFEAGREAPTVSDLCDRFEEDHLLRTRPKTKVEYQRLIKAEIRGDLGAVKVASVTFSDVDRLHRKITRRGSPYVANRVVALLSKMFSLAIHLKWAKENPTRGIERNPEEKRERFLSGDELMRLTAALAKHPDQQSANAVRLLLLTGARRGEVLSSTWDQFDLGEGRWTKPGASTKSKKVHVVPLSAPARQLVASMKAKADRQADRHEAPSPFLFPGRVKDRHQVEIKGQWAAIRKAASLSGVRIHDLRHTYASLLASSGFSLPMIGSLLGHTQAQTTQRYAHLFDSAQRKATERVGAQLMAAAKKSPGRGKVVAFR
jgi:integrase